MKIKITIIIILVIITLAFQSSPYARRIRPFSSTPSLCQENEIGYNMTSHELVICTNTGYVVLATGGSGSFAPNSATYITQTPNGTLTNEQALSALSTGILRSTTGTGVIDILLTSGTGNTVPIGTFTSLTSNDVLTWNGTNWVNQAASGGSLGDGNVNMTLANEGVTGTTANKLVKITGAPSMAIISATGDTDQVLGVCTNGCGTTGNATIAVLGQVQCVFSSGTTAGNFVINSDTSAGSCKDGGSSFPTDRAAIGRVLSTNGGAGTYTIELMTPDVAFQNAGNGKSKPGGSNTHVQFHDTGNTFGGVSQFTFNKTTQVLTLGGSGAAHGTLTLLRNTGSNALTLGWTGSAQTINAPGTELQVAGGDVYIYTNGSNRWRFNSSGHFQPSGSNGGFDIGTSAFHIRDFYIARSIIFSNLGDATTSEPFITHARTWNNAGVAFENFKSNITNSASATGSTLFKWQVGGTTKFGMNINGRPEFDQTITAGGTTGNQTINKAAGTVNIAAAETTVTVTNSLVTTSSTIYVSMRTDDATCSVKSVVPGSGSFVINLNAACTAETSFGFLVIN